MTILIYFNTSRTKKLGFLSLRCHFCGAVEKVKVTGGGGGVNAKSNLKNNQKAKDIIIFFHIFYTYLQILISNPDSTLFNIAGVNTQ